MVLSIPDSTWGDGRKGGVREVVEERRMMAGGWSVTAMSVVE
jgi:hypothetical protein